MRTAKTFVTATLLAAMLELASGWTENLITAGGVACAAEAGLYVEGARAPIRSIGLSETPTVFERTAARILRDELSTLTGVPPTITKLAGPGTILLGTAAVERGLFSRAEKDRLKEGAYAIRVKADSVGIVAGLGDGLITGAYALLKETGVNYRTRKGPGGWLIWKDPIARINPVGRRLVLRPGTRAATPAFHLRFDHRGHPAVGFTYRHHVKGSAGRFAGSRRAGTGHTLPYLLQVKDYYKEHPEYFALGKKGERVKSPPGHLCLSHPEVERIVARRTLEWIEAQSECTYFAIGQGDGVAWCQCERCKAEDAVPGKVTTDRMLGFVNKIARHVRDKYPDKYLVFLAYTFATAPAPKRVKPEPNVLIMYCMYPNEWACDSHAFCEKNTVGMKQVDDWLAACGPEQVYIQPHPRGYKRALEIFPGFYPVVERVRHYHKLGVNRIAFCGFPQSFGSLFDYVIGKLLWDPSIDVEKTIDEFMPLCYGKAAPYMRAYFDLMNRHIRERNFHEKCEGASPGLVNKAYAAEAYPLFAKAEAAVADDADLLRLVQDEKLQLLYSDLDVHNKVNGTVRDNQAAYAGRVAEFLRLARDRRLKNVGRGHYSSLARWFWQTARIRFNRDPWYRDSEVHAFLNDPAGFLSRDVVVQEKIDGGWRIPAVGFSGGEQPGKKGRSKREIVVLRRPVLPENRAYAYVTLPKAPAGPCVLEVEGQDDDKEGSAKIDILVNGRSVFSGPNGFVEKGFSRRSFRVPAGVLKAGKNRIEFRNITPEQPPAEYLANPRLHRYWGWFILTEALLREVP